MGGKLGEGGRVVVGESTGEVSGSPSGNSVGIQWVFSAERSN